MRDKTRRKQLDVRLLELEKRVADLEADSHSHKDGAAVGRL